jgi:hypothetical protein
MVKANFWEADVGKPLPGSAFGLALLALSVLVTPSFSPTCVSILKAVKPHIKISY